MQADTCNFIKKETLAQVFLCEISKNTSLTTVFKYSTIRVNQEVCLSKLFVFGSLTHYVPVVPIPLKTSEAFTQRCCVICEISKNNFSYRTPLVSAFATNNSEVFHVCKNK